MKLLNDLDIVNHLVKLKLSSQSLKCKVAAIIVNNDGTLLSEGVNTGMHYYMEVTSCCKYALCSKPTGICPKCGEHYSLLSVNVVHAEVNAINKLTCSGVDLTKCTMYTSRFPCAACRKYLKKAGLKWEVLAC